jgi:hypothetical protein
MQQSPYDPDTLGRGLPLPIQPPRIKLLDQFRHALCSRDGIRAIPELHGHKGVSTTMIYTHVLDEAGNGVRSRIDELYPVSTVCINRRG